MYHIKDVGCEYRLSPGFGLLGCLQVLSGFLHPWPAVVTVSRRPVNGIHFQKCNVEKNQRKRRRETTFPAQFVRVPVLKAAEFNISVWQ